MADAQRGQFVIDCKSGEAAGIIYSPCAGKAHSVRGGSASK